MDENFQKLIAEFLDDWPDGDRSDELAGYIQENPELKEHLLMHMLLDEGLSQVHDSRRQSFSLKPFEKDDVPDNPRVCINKKLVKSSRNKKKTSTRKVKTSNNQPVLIYLSGVAALLMFCFSIWLLYKHNMKVEEKPTQVSSASQGNEEQVNQVVGAVEQDYASQSNDIDPSELPYTLSDWGVVKTIGLKDESTSKQFASGSLPINRPFSVNADKKVRLDKSDGSIIRLYGPAEFMIPEDQTFILKKGKLFADISKQKGQALWLKTPKAHVKVVGTRFYLTHKSSGSSIEMLEGKVEFTDLITHVTQPVLGGESLNTNSSIVASRMWHDDMVIDFEVGELPETVLKGELAQPLPGKRAGRAAQGVLIYGSDGISRIKLNFGTEEDRTLFRYDHQGSYLQFDYWLEGSGELSCWLTLNNLTKGNKDFGYDMNEVKRGRWTQVKLPLNAFSKNGEGNKSLGLNTGTCWLSIILKDADEKSRLLIDNISLKR
ncbi:MAG: FecR domain-containing protein [Planctomycetes bacterium]|nr:FecR domain-containing protein [Planctomycetota bacterium]